MKYIKASWNSIKNAMVQIASCPLNVSIVLFILMFVQIGSVSGKLKVIYIIQLILMADKGAVELGVKDLVKGVNPKQRFMIPIVSIVYLTISIYIWEMSNVQVLMIFSIEQLIWTILIYLTYKDIRSKLDLIEKTKVDTENKEAVE